MGAIIGGTTSIGCRSITTDGRSDQKTNIQKRKADQISELDPEKIKLSHQLAIKMAMTDRLNDTQNDWEEESLLESDFFEGNTSMQIGYKPGNTNITLDWDYHENRKATRHAIFDRLNDFEGDEKYHPSFPIGINYHLNFKKNRSWKPLANHDFINSVRLSIDNLTAASLYGMGMHDNLNESIAYRSLSLLLQSAIMLGTSRFGHEFAHGYDTTIREKDELPLKGFISAIPNGNESISYVDMISSQAAGLNNSSSMALAYWRQAETRGNIVAALGFLLARNDALIQWVYGHAINDGEPEKYYERQALLVARNRENKTLDDFEEEFKTEDLNPKESLNPSIYQVTGHGDNVAYIKLLEVFGYGNAHRDKDLGIILGTNTFTAYFWQSMIELINYVGNGKQTHERWRVLGPLEWPVFSTYRMPKGYLTQMRLPIVLRKSILDRLTLIGARDLDPVLGKLNTTQFGAELSGRLPGKLEAFRWQFGSLLSFDRKQWQLEGNQVNFGLSYETGPVTFSLTGTHHQNDPLLGQVELQDNGFSLQIGAQIELGPWKKSNPIQRPLPSSPIPRNIVFQDFPKNSDIDKPAPSDTVILSKR